MKLRNRKTGEIIEFDAILPVKDVAGDSVAHLEYGSLAELNKEWEDYEEPKEYWVIDYDGGIIPFNIHKETAIDKLMKQIGNYFETIEEAELAVRKLKAWKRLKDKGFEFVGLSYSSSNEVYFEFVDEPLSKEQAIEAEKDLDLLFGGEE